MIWMLRRAKCFSETTTMIFDYNVDRWCFSDHAFD